LNRENNILKKELDHLTSENKNLLEEIISFKQIESELLSKLSNTKTIAEEIDNKMNSILMIVKAYSMKFEVSDQLFNGFEKDFSEKIKNFLNFYNKTQNKTTLDNLRSLEDWIKQSCVQIEKAEQKRIFLSEFNEENINKIKRLESNLKEMNYIEEEKLNSEKNLFLKIRKLEEEKKTIYEEKENLEKEFDHILKEFNLLKLETKNKIDELSDLEQQKNEISITNERLSKEIFKQEKKILNTNYQEKALEERIKILYKEKKYFENLLVKLGNAHSQKNISRIVNDILNICDSISSLERDKIKIVNNINNIEYDSTQQSILKNDPNLNLTQSLKYEKEENMNVLNEYNKKIGKDKFRLIF